MEAIKYEKDKDGGSVLIKDGEIETWVDVTIDNEDVMCDWNKYIFHLNNPKDVKIGEWQSRNFDEASSLAIAKLEAEKIIQQRHDGKWQLWKKPLKLRYQVEYETVVYVDDNEETNLHLLGNVDVDIPTDKGSSFIENSFKVVSFHPVIMPHLFDDLVEDETGTWTQVCETHANEYKHLGTISDVSISLNCGVRGCNNEAIHYLDIKA